MTHDRNRMAARAADLQRQGRTRMAIAAYRELLGQFPDDPDAWYDLGWLERSEGNHVAALAAFNEALERNVRDAHEVHLNRAVIYADHLRRAELAKAELECAIALKPDYAPALMNLGNLAEESADGDAAADFYKRVLNAAAVSAHDSEMAAEALARLFHLEPPESASDSRFAAAARAAESAVLSALTRANLWFAAGRAHDSLGEHDAAFDAFDRANAAQRRTGLPYDAGRTERFFDAIMNTFPKPVPASGAVPAGPSPLFICGMFRSGSTLLERVLAGHGAITPGDELNLLSSIADGDLAPFPEGAARLDRARADALAARYTGELARLFPEAGGGLVTDKRPDNFLRIGLIKTLFPAAKIIHTVRNPMDTGLSIYTQHIAQQLAPYSSDLGAIGHYFGQYRRLMAHWKALYPDDIHEFSYDDFVAAPRDTLAPLLKFLGLEWEDALMEFHARRDVVKTASYWQVRKPLYRESSGRWRPYRERLAPLRAALLKSGVATDD